MGLELDKTIRFAETLVANRKTSVSLKFLLTPLTVHELNLFLRWALALALEFVVVYDSGFKQYINENTEGKFGAKIIARTAQAVQAEFLHCDFEKLRSRKTVIAFERTHLFGINAAFIEQNGLQGIIKAYDS